MEHLHECHHDNSNSILSLEVFLTHSPSLNQSSPAKELDLVGSWQNPEPVEPAGVWPSASWRSFFVCWTDDRILILFLCHTDLKTPTHIVRKAQLRGQSSVFLFISSSVSVCCCEWSESNYRTSDHEAEASQQEGNNTVVGFLSFLMDCTVWGCAESNSWTLVFMLEKKVSQRRTTFSVTLKSKHKHTIYVHLT